MRGSDPTSASARWVARHQATVWRYLRLLGCPVELAEDLTQETFLAAWGAREAITTDAGADGWPPAGWLRTTARNLYFMHLRAARRSPSTVDVDGVEEVWQRHAVDEGSDGYRSALRRCLHELGPRARQALQLRYGEGLSRDELGLRLGMQSEGVKSLLQRVRKNLRACVEARRQNDAD